MTPLHHIGDSLRQILLSVPLPLVRVLFVSSLVVLLAWVLSLPRSATTPPGGVQHRGENLKVGAAITLAIQILIYSML